MFKLKRRKIINTQKKINKKDLVAIYMVDLIVLVSLKQKTCHLTLNIIITIKCMKNKNNKINFNLKKIQKLIIYIIRIKQKNKKILI